MPSSTKKPSATATPHLEILEERCLPSRDLLGLAAFEPRLVTTDGDPTNARVVATGKGLDGVVQILCDTGRKDANGNTLYDAGTGTLLATGRHVLTVAHVVTHDGTTAYAADKTFVNFLLPGGTTTATVAKVTVHANWTDNVAQGNDLAILELSQPADARADRYELFDPDATGIVGKRAYLAGYGNRGAGATGAVDNTYGTRRGGWNVIDTLAERFNSQIPRGTAFAYDFDDGTAAHDAFGVWQQLPERGLGKYEVNTAPGDSGGPTFVNGRVAGAHSYGFGFTAAPDVHPGTDSSFGEVSVDTYLPGLRSWIDDVLGTKTVDDGDAGVFSTTGTWERSGLGGFSGDSLYSYNGSATYTFSNLPQGYYRVLTNTPGHTNSSTGARYTITAGTSVRATTLDQRPGTRGWAELDSLAVATGATVSVKVAQGTGATGAVRADAVRLERIEDPGTLLVDDGDAGFAATGGTQASSLGGYRGDSRFLTSGTAVYTFAGLRPGRYRVAANSPSNDASSTRALYKIVSGATTKLVPIDQRIGTNGWLTLETLDVTGDTATVTLSQGGVGSVRADALRLERVNTFFEEAEKELNDYLGGGGGGSFGIFGGAAGGGRASGGQGRSAFVTGPRTSSSAAAVDLVFALEPRRKTFHND